MSANIDYVTSHQGVAHITTQNVIDLLAGISGDISGIKIFPQLYAGLEHEITAALTIQVKPGAALAGGSFWILEDPFDWEIDPGAVGYSRIDVLYLVMYKDPITEIESCDFVYESGNLYPNGTSGTAPDAPTGTNITATYPFLRMNMTDGSIVSVTDYGEPYLSNSELSSKVDATNNALNGLKFGIDGDGKYGYYKVGADTVTPFRNPTGNATQADVLEDKTFSSASEENVAGTMPNRGAWLATGTPTGNNQVDVPIPAGYHDGSGKVTCKGQDAYSNGYTSGRNQGRADKKAFTMRITASNWRGIYEIGVYCDGVLVWGPSQIGETADVSATLYASFNGKVTSS